MEWTEVSDWLLSHGIRILIIIAIGVAIYFVLKIMMRRGIRRGLERTMKGVPQAEIEKRETTLVWLFIATSKVVIVLIALVLILSEVGINVGALLAGLGVAGIAVAFAAQSFVKDLIAGFVIAVENQYNIGDVVTVADVTGVVEEMNIRRTTLRDLEGILHIVPNGEIRVTSNYTKVLSRAKLDIGVAYKEDADHVMAIVKQTWEELAQDPDWGSSIISKTPTILRVNELGDSAVVIRVVGDTEAMKQWGVMGEFRRRIKKLFDEKGIEIPWPHRKVYFGDTGLEEGEARAPRRRGPRGKEKFLPSDAVLPPSGEEVGGGQL